MIFIKKITNKNLIDTDLICFILCHISFKNHLPYFFVSEKNHPLYCSPHPTHPPHPHPLLPRSLTANSPGPPHIPPHIQPHVPPHPISKRFVTTSPATQNAPGHPTHSDCYKLLHVHCPCASSCDFIRRSCDCILHTVSP